MDMEGIVRQQRIAEICGESFHAFARIPSQQPHGTGQERIGDEEQGHRRVGGYSRTGALKKGLDRLRMAIAPSCRSKHPNHAVSSKRSSVSSRVGAPAGHLPNDGRLLHHLQAVRELLALVKVRPLVRS
jgi:hypothetical protein